MCCVSVYRVLPQPGATLRPNQQQMSLTLTSLDISVKSWLCRLRYGELNSPFFPVRRQTTLRVITEPDVRWRLAPRHCRSRQGLTASLGLLKHYQNFVRIESRPVPFRRLDSIGIFRR